ncbi:MAG: hypothetical protein BWK73_15240 [Thiothrix lacustris]|uniref:Sulfatase-modifying factor enzyme domain-containing protein n=1 Tax=Thiothrix lacustris TaxID=525917 RepID=A0A1Y1QRT7_9GAMM|nr:MAG: hypothetical protein BWK73_15240 [Thiothrix lacustris]
MLRGGSWNNNAQSVRSANRNNNTPGNRNNNNGFRLASAQTPAVAAVDQMSILPVVYASRRKANAPRYVSRQSRTLTGGVFMLPA